MGGEMGETTDGADRGRPKDRHDTLATRENTMITPATTSGDVDARCSTFVVPAESYDRLVGRYLPSLGPAFADAAGIGPGMRVLDVGCGPGGLTNVLAQRCGAAQVAAVDPSAPFVQACRDRVPGVEVRQGVAEDLPYGPSEFDATLACLVVGFMRDPERGVREMLRVTRPGGTVAACFWDLDRMPVLEIFWSAARALDPSISGEVRRPGGGKGELAALLAQAGAADVREGTINAHSDYTDFDDWWSAYSLGVGPTGAYYRSLTETQRESLRAACHERLDRPQGGFTLHATCWFAAGTATT
jgi:SAM-dependent methyltransferase